MYVSASTDDVGAPMACNTVGHIKNNSVPSLFVICIWVLLFVFRLLKEMPRKGNVHLTTTRNAIVRRGYIPVQWKVAQIIIPKPGKPTEEVSSYRPLSLHPIMSKIFEKATLKRLPSVWISTETLYHITSTSNYRDNKRNFRKKKAVLLCGIPRHHTAITSHKRLIKYGMQDSWIKSGKSLPTHITEH
jgi:hypothetical protein